MGEAFPRHREAEGVPAVTLLVRHLPEAIPSDVLERLFSHYGASSIRHFVHGRVKNCAFVDFRDEISASQAQKQLHGLSYLGKVLSVERAIHLNRKHQETERHTKKELPSTVKDASVSKGASDSPWNFPNLSAEPIAKKLGVDYPFPPHLQYAYPPPDGNILTNIVNALIAVPRFYTQVLHLMNKMCIPAPFGKALPTPPLPSAPVSTVPPPQSAERKREALSTSESEMESSDEETRGEGGPEKKRAKRQAIVGPAVDKHVDHEAVGLKSVRLVSKEKPIIKKKNPVLQIRITSKQNELPQQDDVAVEETLEPSAESSDMKTFITLQELDSGKLPPEEILSLPRFKNYTPGDPSHVLYIKNLAKEVVVNDFYSIFGSFFGSIDAAKSNLSVKLMQNAVNGYVFKGKPIVIQFGRSPAKVDQS